MAYNKHKMALNNTFIEHNNILLASSVKNIDYYSS
jgi:hypothetical protein